MSEESSAPLMNSIEQETLDWPEVDKQWLSRQPTQLQHVAVRHGRELYTLVMNAGMVSFVLTTLHGNIKHGEARQMLQNVARVVDLFVKKILPTIGKDTKQFAECQQDIERLAQLQDPEGKLAGARVSKGGIILDS